jgi:predicted RNA polymerase sigma factor
VNRAEIFKANLQTRVKRREESISELAQSIKKWTRQAYPNAPSTVISTLARDHFIDALPESDMRLRIREGHDSLIRISDLKF